MLVLTRKLGETITIGEDIRITVLALKGNQVKLGIEAPEQTNVHRQEVHERIIEENLKAAATSHRDVSTLGEFWRRHSITGKK